METTAREDAAPVAAGVQGLDEILPVSPRPPGRRPARGGRDHAWSAGSARRL